MTELQPMLRPTPGTLTDIQTALVRLSPAFVAAVKKAAGRRRRAKLPYIVGLAVLAMIAVLGADRSTREFARERAERWRHVLVRPRASAKRPEPPAATLSTAAQDGVARAPAFVVPVQEIVSTTASAKKTGRTGPRSASTSRR
jgi:hypothetical protein